MKKGIFVFCVLVFLFSASQSFARDAQGGGFTDQGITGQWFNNTTFSGDPAFERKEARIQFDWGTTYAPGGSIYNGYDALGTDNYSVRWAGSLIPRYSEDYTFFLTVDDGAILKIRPEGGSWTTLINQPTTVGEHSATFNMTAGTTYEVEIDYVEFGGNAKAILEWSGASFPREVIDPLFQMSLIAYTYDRSIWAEGITGGRGSWEHVWPKTGPLNLDELGNPTEDGQFLFFEILQPAILNPKFEGTMHLSFNGSATNIIGRRNCYLIPGSVNYDPVLNQTTAFLVGTNAGSAVGSFALEGTSRTGTFGGPGGVANVKLRLPSMEDPAVPFAENVVFHPMIIDAFSRLSGLRFMRANDQAVEWADRTPPSWPYQRNGLVQPYVYNDRYGDGIWDIKGQSEMSHEYEIMLCNITGNDYYVGTPHLATMDYFNQLALLIKNGSDAAGNPYASPVANPVYPPLNPNLRVYVELANELWNNAQVGSYAPYYDLQNETLDMYNAGDPNFDLLNYDGLLEAQGQNAEGDWNALFELSQRWWILKTAKMSDEFRSVFGDALMPKTSISPRIRPYFGWQYNNANGTCSRPLGFMEKTMSHPPSYYLYAGGGAGYYGAANKFGLMDLSLDSGAFESPVVSGYELRPTTAEGYVFTGDAGIGTEGYLNMPEPQQMSETVDNNQAVYLNGSGASVSFTFTAPMDQDSPIYGVNYQAVLPEGTVIEWDEMRLSLKVDGVEKAVLTGSGTQPEPWNASVLWNRKAYWVDPWYFSENLILDPGQTITITFSSLTDTCPVFIDHINMTSLDAYYGSEIPSGGSAMGQQVVGKLTHGETVMGDGRWSAAYGLEYMTYEHGWSAGGDSGDTPLQVFAKYEDPRAATAQYDAIQIFERAGGFNATFGVYGTWPRFDEPNRELGSLNVDAWPLVQGMNQAAKELPDPIINGAEIPGSLYASQWNAVPDAHNPNYENLPVGDWVSYHFVAERAGAYRIAVRLDGGGEVALSTHGKETQVATGTASGTLFADVTFALGINVVRITATSGTVAIQQVSCAPASYADAEILEIRAKYLKTATEDAVVLNELWIDEDFGTTTSRLHGFKNDPVLDPWNVQSDEVAVPGFEVRIDSPLSATGGAYITGGQAYRSAGATIDFDQIPAGFHQEAENGESFGVPGTAFFTAFSLRRDQASSVAEAGWSKRSPAWGRGDNQALVMVQGATWSLALKDLDGTWIQADSGIPALIGQVYEMGMELSFTEYGTTATLWIDGVNVVTNSTDAEITPLLFIFYPGDHADEASLDDLRVGDSLESLGLIGDGGGSATVEETVTLTFNTLADGPLAHFEEQGYLIQAFAFAGNSNEVHAISSGYESSVIRPQNWSGRITITKGGELFTLNSFEHGTTSLQSWGNDQTVIVTSDQGDSTAPLNYNGMNPLQEEILNWENVTSVTFDWNGGNSRFGVIDNIMLTSEIEAFITFGAINSGPSVGPNGFGFTLNGGQGHEVVIQACSNLIQNSWISISTNNLTTESEEIWDAHWDQHDTRYYRTILP